MSRTIISGLQVLSDKKWWPHYAVVIENQLIKTLIPEEMIAHHFPAKLHHFPDDHYLIPGLIDLHVHGANGADVMDGTLAAFNKISEALASEGITHFLATTMTAPQTEIETVLAELAQHLQSVSGAKILGIHLEGPFIAKDKRGAQSDFTLNPNYDLFLQWQTLSNNNIRIVTLAPELDGAIEFITKASQQNVITSIGHTNASFEQTQAAIHAGARQATHLFNAMRGIHQREPGAVTALLLDDSVRAEMIADGVHVHPAVIQMTYKLKHRQNLLLVTDAMRAKHLPDGEYDLGGQTISVVNSIARLNEETLAGSTLTMPRAIKNMMDFTKCSLIDAVQMASTNPAQALGLTSKGYIDAGMDADFTVLNQDLEVVLTMCEGQQIFP